MEWICPSANMICSFCCTNINLDVTTSARQWVPIRESHYSFFPRCAKQVRKIYWLLLTRKSERSWSDIIRHFAQTNPDSGDSTTTHPSWKRVEIGRILAPSESVFDHTDISVGSILSGRDLRSRGNEGGNWGAQSLSYSLLCMVRPHAPPSILKLCI